ncbi:MAG: hypothetical protein QOF53_359 [Nocardioidaceae bacterium]|jgi:uncharacterized protein YkwD|nr:hypothetical protein [Nocardioidaceae bacterium]
MNMMRALRPAQKILTATVVTVVAASGMLSDPASAADRSALAGAGEGPMRLVSTAAHPVMSSRAYRRQVQRLVNSARRRHHLRPLRGSACAQRVAGRWSAHLAAERSLRHQSMRRLLRTCRARYVGETLGRGAISPSTLVGLWMHSTPHRRVLLSRSPRHIGIGATPDGHGAWVVAANLMRF